ncbi:leucine--tRNA ligase [Candidatus Pacearchaeota archaeon]|nr:leucine--tRNA ligase [Candidatus Pacearchaeota archaeon]
MANTEVGNYNFKKIEKKWQKKWEELGIFGVDADFKGKKKKFYNLEMFPYPSGQGLHIGHSLNYTIGDIRSRFKRMKGFNVLYPMGYDAFGLPAENAAIKAGIHPKKYTDNAIRNFIQQQKALGLSYDWSKTLRSCDPEYYKWNQFFFLKFLEKDLVYRKKAPVNWCPKCNTVLANEQVVNGCCWRHEDTEVEIKNLEQWFIKITDYADELLDCIDDLDWPDRIKTMQKNWIGRSEGAEIDFEVNGEKFPIFTTRPDTIFGVTFMVISAQHPRLMEFVSDSEKTKVEKFLKKIKSVSEKHFAKGNLDKEGIFTGSYAINPANGEKIPVWAGNFVVADYGSGMVMAVPAHDQRDFEFAKKYGIEIQEVVKSDEGVKDKAFSGEGKLINSQKFNDLDNEKAKKEIVKFLEKQGLARKKVQYKIRDWLISRQRYWGTPIPVVYCDACGIVPVNEKDLPVKLPDKVEFGKGNPLKTNEKFVNTICPKCGNSQAKRETDTMDTFVDSSWYFMRYPDNKNSKEPFNKKKENYWLPVDTYIGGAEHAVMHLLYARFWAKALRDLGFLGGDYDEPFKQLFNQGMLHAEDGRKMSKSLGNVINPIEIINSEGADALRLTLMSFASPDSDTNWDNKILQGSLKFLNKVYNNFSKIKIGKSSLRIESKLNQTIKLVTNDIENFNYNLAIIKLRELFGSFGNEESRKVLEESLKLLHPFCPHITEELWSESLGKKGFISLASWPQVDESKINEKYEKQEKAVEKLISDTNNILNLLKEKTKVSGDKIYFYVLPNEKEIYEERLDEIKKRIGKDIFLYSVADKDKYDPENKAKKVKPMKPGIYIE